MLCVYKFLLSCIYHTANRCGSYFTVAMYNDYSLMYNIYRQHLTTNGGVIIHVHSVT